MIRSHAVSGRGSLCALILGSLESLRSGKQNKNFLKKKATWGPFNPFNHTVE